jgi:hypothetical protein
MSKIRALLASIALTTTIPAAWSQQQFQLPQFGGTDDAALAKAMPILAKQVIAGHTDANQGRYLGNLFRLQMVAGDDSVASSALQQLTRLFEALDPKRPTASLIPDELAVKSVRRTPLVSRQLSQGSRLLVLLAVNRNEFGQINYGTGKDVSDESIADAKTPLHIRWLNDSWITVPISRRQQ